MRKLTEFLSLQEVNGVSLREVSSFVTASVLPSGRLPWYVGNDLQRGICKAKGRVTSTYIRENLLYVLTLRDPAWFSESVA